MIDKIMEGTPDPSFSSEAEERIDPAKRLGSFLHY